MSTKKIVINNDMVQQTKSHITNLFKPPYNPFEDRPVAEGGLNKNHFALQQYNANSTDNPVKTMYNKKNIITNLFLVTEDFVTFMNRLNIVWESEAKPRVMTEISYAANPTTGYITVGTVDPTPRSIVLPLVMGPTGNKASHFDEYENNPVSKGLWGTGSSAYFGAASSSIQELMLRHLYSLDAEKREVAFQIAELYYSITNSEVTSAKLGLLPAKDFNSANFTITLDGDQIILTYPNPIEFDIHYDELVHNPLNKNLYLYFPYITSNAMRPKNIGTDTNKYDGPISIYTGADAALDSLLNIPVSSPFTDYQRHGNTFTYMLPSPTTTSYGALTANQNTDMPTLTNAVWSKNRGMFTNQAGYTVIRISETGGAGDITFDHTDKIDFIDSLKFIIKAPTVFA